MDRGRDPQDDRLRRDYDAEDSYRNRRFQDRGAGGRQDRHDGYDDDYHHRNDQTLRDYHYRGRERSASPAYLRYSDDSPGRRRTRSPDPPRRYPGHQDRGGTPTNELLLSGLPRQNANAISEDIIKKRIQELSQVAVISVRIIVDKPTGRPKGFGFVTFPSVDAAEKFLDNFPQGFSLHTNGETFNVHVAFAITPSREYRNALDPEWICAKCGASNRATRTECYQRKCDFVRPENVRFNLSGTHDPSIAAAVLGKPGETDRSPDATPSPFLLILGISSRVSTSMLAKGISKLYCPEDGTLAVPQQSSKSTGVGLNTSNPIAGARKGSIKRVFLVKDKKSHMSRGYGFAEFHSIEDAIAALAKYNSEESLTIASNEVDICHPHNGIFRPAMSRSEYTIELAVTGQPMEYWQQGAYILEEWIEKDPPAPDPSKANTQGSESTTPSATVLANAKKQIKKMKADPVETPKPGTGAMGALFNSWSKAQNQLSDAKTTTTTTSKEQQSFIDPNPSKPACYLCSLKFPSVDSATAHSRESNKHKSLLFDPEKIKKAYQKLLKAGVISEIPDLADEKSPAAVPEPYIDRAKQRRLDQRKDQEESEAYNRPEKISFSLGRPTKRAASLEADAAPSPPATGSKGLGMMRKMGYTGVGGLGLDGAGEAGPLDVAMYASGVGLGAEGGRLGDAVEQAGRNTRNSHEEYLDMVRDRAKARFERME